MSWEVVNMHNGFIQVIPLDDLSDHSTITPKEKDGIGSLNTSDCPCSPRLEFTQNGYTIIIHNSFDGREGLEWATDILNK